MRWLKFLLLAAVTGGFLYLLSVPLGPIRFPLGAFLSPGEGFWRNAENPDKRPDINLSISGLQAPVQVVMDDRGVPHIFAQNEHDLAMAQGYLTARDRLWQMEFQTIAASGRLSEFFGEIALEKDRETRRKGMVFAAENAEKMILADHQTKVAAEAYRDGINAWIAGLDPRDYPLEYKILHYAPEPWTTLKTSLLLKFMAENLSFRVNDLEFTRLLAAYGLPTFAQLHPSRPQREVPIISVKGSTTKWLMEMGFAVGKLPEAPKDYNPDSLTADLGTLEPQQLAFTDPVEDEDMLGSNNWAVSGARTSTGTPMLANDPHLGLNLPSLWYEVQLSIPGQNVYGASLPGAPGVVIGFNDSIAWGVTNGTRDVVDFYRVTFKDSKRNEYRYNGQWKQTVKRVEAIKVKGKPVVYDTVIYTHLGPVMFDENFGDAKAPLALRWIAHDPSNEAKTFLQLNRAKNYADYTSAISTFQCPAQNFVFASRKGDIAIWHQGKFPNRWAGQGKFIQDASRVDHGWNSFIPQAHNPHEINPERGWVSSTNQLPTDAFYPYYYSGDAGGFEPFRNRRIAELLNGDASVTVKDMQAFQLDNYSYLAADVLPTLLAEIDSNTSDPDMRFALKQLRSWRYRYDANDLAAAIFQTVWDTLHPMIWNDDYIAKGLSLETGLPTRNTTSQLLRDSATFRFYDILSTPMRETRHDVVNIAFREAVKTLKTYNNDPQQWAWAKRKNTTIRHLVPLFTPFHRGDLPNGGNKGTLNACNDRHGPSWRMVVSLGPEIEAYGIYPGGQNGNPGAKGYDAFVDDWAAGTYYKLWFMQGAGDNRGKAVVKMQLMPG